MSRLLLALCSFSLAGCFAEPPGPDDVAAESDGDGGSDELSGSESDESDGGGSSEGAGSGSTGGPLAALHEACSGHGDCEGSLSGTSACFAQEGCDGENMCWTGECGGQPTGVQCVAGTCTAWVAPDIDPDLECPAGETQYTIVNDATTWRADVCAMSAEIVDGLARCPEGMEAAVWNDVGADHRNEDVGQLLTCWWSAVPSGDLCSDASMQPGLGGDMLPRLCE